MKAQTEKMLKQNENVKTDKMPEYGILSFFNIHRQVIIELQKPLSKKQLVQMIFHAILP